MRLTIILFPPPTVIDNVTVIALKHVVFTRLDGGTFGVLLADLTDVSVLEILLT